MKIATYKDISVTEAVNGYIASIDRLGLHAWIGDGVGVFEDDSGVPIRPGTLQFAQAIQNDLEEGYDDWLEAYFNIKKHVDKATNMFLITSLLSNELGSQGPQEPKYLILPVDMRSIEQLRSMERVALVLRDQLRPKPERVDFIGFCTIVTDLPDIKEKESIEFAIDNFGYVFVSGDLWPETLNNRASDILHIEEGLEYIRFFTDTGDTHATFHFVWEGEYYMYKDTISFSIDQIERELSNESILCINWRDDLLKTVNYLLDA